MLSPYERPQAVRFGAFEMDLHACELRKNGLKVKLQEQPFRVLSELVWRAPELVVREKLYLILSAHHSYDCKHALNNAIQKSRAALGDSPDGPRFIETIPGRGYRFVAPVQVISRGRNGNHGSNASDDEFLLKIKEARQELLARTTETELLQLYYRVHSCLNQHPYHPNLDEGRMLCEIIWGVIEHPQSVSKRTLAKVFHDPNALSIPIKNSRHWRTMGRIGSEAVMVVDHTMGEENGQEVVWITSGRNATPDERAEYERNGKNKR